MKAELKKLVNRKPIERKMITVLIDKELLVAVDKKRSKINVTRTKIVELAFREFLNLKL